MKMIFAMRDAKNAPHVYRIDTAVSQKAIEDLPIEWVNPFGSVVLADAVARWFGTTDALKISDLMRQMRDPNGWTISDDFRHWHAPDLVSPVAESGDWQGMDTTRHPDEPEGRDIIDNEGK
jgi:hypothetical protein